LVSGTTANTTKTTTESAKTTPKEDEVGW